MIDGPTRFGAFRLFILPLAAPGRARGPALYAFTQSWNEFLYALVFITNVKLRTSRRALDLHHGRRLRLGLPDGGSSA